MLTTAGTFSTDIPASHLYSLSASRTSRSFCYILLSRASAPLSPRLHLVQEGMQNLCDLKITFWNKIILDEIIKLNTRHPQVPRVESTHCFCPVHSEGLLWRVALLHLHCSLTASSSCNSKTDDVTRISAFTSSTVFGYACDQAWQMAVNLSGASNVWALLAECTYVYSRYVWLYYWG
jgi:hypothetical protein